MVEKDYNVCKFSCFVFVINLVTIKDQILVLCHYGLFSYLKAWFLLVEQFWNAYFVLLILNYEIFGITNFGVRISKIYFLKYYDLKHRNSIQSSASSPFFLNNPRVYSALFTEIFWSVDFSSTSAVYRYSSIYIEFTCTSID